MKAARYGWIPDLPDQRDLQFDPIAALIASATGPVLPSAVDLRPHCPPVYDQGQIGSCTANAIAAAVRFTQKWTYSIDIFDPSRLFIYYNERRIEGTIASDSGAQLRDGIKSVATDGVCPNSEWGYEHAFDERPWSHCYTDAKKDLLTQYLRIQQGLVHMKACLAGGWPFVFGFTVYEGFESDAVASSGIVPMPGASESVIGGHAVMCVGYQDADRAFLCQNSWGPAWGEKGFFTLPYDYMVNPDLAADFWTLRKMEQ